VIRGLAGKDRIEGGADADDLNGGAGDDFVRGDIFLEDAGADLVFGGPGNDELFGGPGKDRLAGGAGVDRLLGEAGSDLFAFGGSATGVGADRRDVILDFARGDRLDLSRVDARTGTAGDQAFAFIGTQAFSAPGQLRVAAAEATIVQASWDADRAPELEIEIAGRHAFSVSDFLL
jgi:Ca2+-binding RTX toxin-like protein